MKSLIFIVVLTLTSTSLMANDSAINDMLEIYKSQGAENFSASKGKENWEKKMASKKGDERTCTTCHNTDFTKSGEHKKNGKVIKPMSPTTNPKRFTKVKKIKKWLKRNCKWTWGRECTPQEKGDLLVFLQQQ